MKEKNVELELSGREEISLFNLIAKSPIKQQILRALLRETSLHYNKLWDSIGGSKTSISIHNAELVDFGVLGSEYTIIESKKTKRKYAAKKYWIKQEKKDMIKNILAIIEDLRSEKK